jgi:hypothetical protein
MGQNSRIPRIDDVPHDPDDTAAGKQKLNLTPDPPRTTLFDWISFAHRESVLSSSSTVGPFLDSLVYNRVWSKSRMF